MADVDSGSSQRSVEDVEVSLAPNNNEKSTTGKRSCDDVVPAIKIWTTKSDEAVKIHMGDSGVEALKPVTIQTVIENTVQRVPNHIAMAVKRNGVWVNWTYKEYLADIRKAAKSFIKAGLQPHNAVCILGFNSPEWIISLLGCVYAGGLGTGVYATNNAETCKFILEDCSCNVAVVENTIQLKKILSIWHELPKLKAIVQYTGEVEEKKENVYTWAEFMKLSEEVEDSQLQERCDNQAPNKACILIYTSGTTGNPKGVMISHDNVTWTSKVVEIHLQYKFAGEVCVSYLPLSHIAGQLLDVHGPYLIGATVYFANPDALKGTLKDTLVECKPTYFFGVPRVWEKLMEKMVEKGRETTGLKKRIAIWAKGIGLTGTYAMMEGKPVPWGWTLANILVFNKVKQALGFDRCRFMVTGAAPITRETVDYFMSLNIPLLSVYGMSECTGPETLDPLNSVRVGSVGKAIAGLQLKLDKVNSDGEGEICMYGRHVFMGYLNNDSKTDETLDKKGWIHSGDLGKIDENGYLYVTGRIKELIITSGGENIAPIPIEDNIKAEVPGISNCMVVGDYKKFLSVLITMKVNVDVHTGQPSDDFLPEAVDWCKSIGSEATKVADVLDGKDSAVTKVIEEGIKKANQKAQSNAAKVQKFRILPVDFSIPGGELGPTLKLRRPVVTKLYKNIIDEIYNC